MHVKAARVIGFVVVTKSAGSVLLSGMLCAVDVSVRHTTPSDW